MAAGSTTTALQRRRSGEFDEYGRRGGGCSNVARTGSSGGIGRISQGGQCHTARSSAIQLGRRSSGGAELSSPRPRGRNLSPGPVGLAATARAVAGPADERSSGAKTARLSCSGPGLLERDRPRRHSLLSSAVAATATVAISAGLAASAAAPELPATARAAPEPAAGAPEPPTWRFGLGAAVPAGELGASGASSALAAALGRASEALGRRAIEALDRRASDALERLERRSSDASDLPLRGSPFSPRDPQPQQPLSASARGPGHVCIPFGTLPDRGGTAFGERTTAVASAATAAAAAAAVGTERPRLAGPGLEERPRLVGSGAGTGAGSAEAPPALRPAVPPIQGWKVAAAELGPSVAASVQQAWGAAAPEFGPSAKQGWAAAAPELGPSAKQALAAVVAVQATPMKAGARPRAQSAIRDRAVPTMSRARSADPRRRDGDAAVVRGAGDPRPRERSPEVPMRRGAGPGPATGEVAAVAAAARASAERLAALASASALLRQQQVPFKDLPSALYGGRYRIGKFLGRGASASVWEAEHQELKVRVAVKVFDQGSRDKKQAHRELRILARVQHPRILDVLEVVETAHIAHLVCGFVDAETLRSFTQKQPQGRLREELAREFFRQTLDGVHYCHERLVAHRDLKLENLLLDRCTHDVKIIDFGFAAQVVCKDTKLKAFCGTPSYMAPEIIKGDGYSGFAADIWALGVVLYAMLTGSLPFTARTEMALYAKIRRGSFNCPDVLQELPRRVVKGALRLEAVARPSAGSMLRQAWMVDVVAGDRGSTPSPTLQGLEQAQAPSAVFGSALAAAEALAAPPMERAPARRASTGGSSMGTEHSDGLPTHREQPASRRASTGGGCWQPGGAAVDSGDTGGTDDKLLLSGRAAITAVEDRLLTSGRSGCGAAAPAPPPPACGSARTVKVLPPGPGPPGETRFKAAFEPTQRTLLRNAMLLGGS